MLEALASSSLAPLPSAERLAGRGGIFTLKATEAGGLVERGEMLVGDEMAEETWMEATPVGLELQLELELALALEPSRTDDGTAVLI